MAIPRAEILRAIIHCVKTCWVLAWISVHLVRRKGRDTLGDISLQHKSLCTGWATSCCNRLRDTLQRQIASWNCARKNLSLQQNFVATTGCTNSIWFDFGRAVASSHHPPRAGFFYYSIFIGIPSGSLCEAESFFKKKKTGSHSRVFTVLKDAPAKLSNVVYKYSETCNEWSPTWPWLVSANRGERCPLSTGMPQKVWEECEARPMLLFCLLLVNSG